MGKAEVGTPKYIANKMKSKGLQKLRWFCQMCEKQCRDENGFKCHTMSESHQRQLLLFADTPHRFINEFSRQFQRDFLNLLKRQFGTKRVYANKVYQEYISNKQHLHMNATQWETLTDFVKWLGREGICTADETEKGWFITYIDKDPDMIKLQESKAKKEKMAKDDDEKMLEFLEKQIELGKKSSNLSTENSATELQKDENEKLSLKLNFKSDKRPKESLIKSSIFTDTKMKNVFKKPAKKPEKRPMTAIEAIIKEEQEEKERKKSRYRHHN